MRRMLFLSLSMIFVFACAEGPVSDPVSSSGVPANNLGKGDMAVDAMSGDPMDTVGLEDTWTEPGDDPLAPGDDPVDGDPIDEEAGEPELDGYAMARDVTAHLVTFPEGTPFPDSYKYPDVDTGFSMGGTEFWQKWTGGENPTFNFGSGSDFGRRCMYASARRFEEIMKSPPEALVTLRDTSNWTGSFFNWNDDYAKSDWSDGSSARLWAWRTTLVKWISQTNKDGSCYLPTLEMLETLIEDCLSTADSYDGEIQGCSAP